MAARRHLFYVRLLTDSIIMKACNCFVQTFRSPRMSEMIRCEKTGNHWFIAIRDEYISKKHWHNEYEFLYVVRGVCRVRVNDADLDIQEGQSLIIGPGVTHDYPETSDEKRIVVVRLSEPFLNQLSPQAQEYYTGLLQDVLRLQRDRRVRSLLHIEPAFFDNESDVSMEAGLTGRVLELLGLIAADPSLIAERILAQRSEPSETLNSMEAYIRGHLCEKITLEGLAGHLGFSPSYCSKYIKRKCGMNFLEYLNIQRVERARELLRSTDLSVTEIAYEVGFSSLQSFNRVFRSYVSMSPSEYKKSLI